MKIRTGVAIGVVGASALAVGGKAAWETDVNHEAERHSRQAHAQRLAIEAGLGAASVSEVGVRKEVYSAEMRYSQENLFDGFCFITYEHAEQDRSLVDEETIEFNRCK